MRADAVRADAHLHPADHLALAQREVGHAQHQRHHDRTISSRSSPASTAGGPHAGAEQQLRHSQSQIESMQHRAHATFCCAATRSTVIAPNIAPSAAVAGCAAATRTQSAGSLSSMRRSQHRLAAALRARARCRRRASRAARTARAFIAGHRRLRRRAFSAATARGARSRRRSRSALRRCAGCPLPAPARSSRARMLQSVVELRWRCRLPPQRLVAHLLGAVVSKPGEPEQVAQHAQHLPRRTRLAQRLHHAAESSARGLRC